MPCPKCGKEVKFLFCDTTEYATYAYDGEEYLLDSHDTVEMAFRCPECNEVIAQDIEMADEILKPKGKLAEGVETSEGRVSHATQA